MFYIDDRVMAFKRLKMSELPSDLVIEILARVPARGLLRFRCVCKSWRSMFQDMSFIRKHTTDHVPTTMIMPLDWYFPLDSPSICTYEGHKIDFLFKEPKLNNGGDKIKTIVGGHCNGLFCLELEDNSFTLWNPILREVGKVSTIKGDQFSSMIGFGYDHSIQDYKIVVITPPFSTSSSKAQVFTLKCSVSKMIPFQWRKGWVESKREGILVGGNIYWLLHVYEHGIWKSQDILTFNVVSETFNYTSSRVTQVYRDLNVLRGSLCAVDLKFKNGDMLVWCADLEKGRIKSWTKILKLKASHIERETSWQVSDFRLGTILNQSGSLLIKVLTHNSGIKLCEYNLEKGTIRKVEASMPISYYGKMKEYIATLVPTRAY